jgi:hypothetical protein
MGERRRRRRTMKRAVNVFITYIYKEMDINNLCIARDWYISSNSFQ